MKLIQLSKEDDLWRFESIGVSDEVEQEFDAIWDDYQRSGDSNLTKLSLQFHLERFPNNVDALHHLSIVYYDLDQHLKAYICSQAAVSLCLQGIPQEFNWDTAQIGYELSNRPFFRAYKGLGQRYAQRGMYEQAQQIFKRLITLNPKDNSGARYELIDVYDKQGNQELINQLVKQYPNEDLLANYAVRFKR